MRKCCASGRPLIFHGTEAISFAPLQKICDRSRKAATPNKCKERAHRKIVDANGVCKTEN
jgi:hypothetical protein